MLNVIGWIGTVASIIGSFTVALQMYFPGYILFLVGSFSWLSVAINRRDVSLGVLNATFFVANTLGLYNALV